MDQFLFNGTTTLEAKSGYGLSLEDEIKSLNVIKRINDNTFGFCEETGEPIGLKRLIARPIATLCIEAQEKHEKNEKIFADT